MGKKRKNQPEKTANPTVDMNTVMGGLLYYAANARDDRNALHVALQKAGFATDRRFSREVERDFLDIAYTLFGIPERGHDNGIRARLSNLFIEDCYDAGEFIDVITDLRDSSEDEGEPKFDPDLSHLCESPIETMFYNAAAKCNNHKDPAFTPVPQHQLEDGKIRLDFALVDQCIAIELDGHEYHKTKEQMIQM